MYSAIHNSHTFWSHFCLFTSATRFQDRHTHFYGTFAFSDVFLAKQARRLIMSAVPCLFGPLFCNLAVFLILTFSSDLCMTELLITGRGGAERGRGSCHTHIPSYCDFSLLKEGRSESLSELAELFALNLGSIAPSSLISCCVGSSFLQTCNVMFSKKVSPFVVLTLESKSRQN